MIIAHLPAGYLASKGVAAMGASRMLAMGVLIGSILPDLDILWFFLVDHGAVHHHNYLTHRPALWAAFLLAGLMMQIPVITGICLGGLFHLALDSVVGKVDWGWPFFELPVTLVEVPATRSHWVFSFLAHWTFALEVMIVIAAGIVAAMSYRRRRNDL